MKFLKLIVFAIVIFAKASSLLASQSTDLYSVEDSVAALIDQIQTNSKAAEEQRNQKAPVIIQLSMMPDILKLGI